MLFGVKLFVNCLKYWLPFLVVAICQEEFGLLDDVLLQGLDLFFVG